jgi:hypothetical protein
MRTRTLALTALAMVAIVGSASAQTPPAAAPAAVEPSIAFGSSWGMAAGTPKRPFRASLSRGRENEAFTAQVPEVTQPIAPVRPN